MRRLNWIRSCLLVVGVLAMQSPVDLVAQTRATNGSFTNPPIVLTVEGTNVWIQHVASTNWESAYPKEELKVKDRGRTGADSRTSIRLSDLSVLRIGWFSEFEIKPLPESGVDAEFSLWHGLLRLLNRDRPGKHRFVTPTATAATRGTEFVLQVDEGTGRTALTVFEGEAELSNAQGSVRIENGEQGIAVAGQVPTKTAVIDARSIVQWCLYYPGVLDLAELNLSAGEETALELSLLAYRGGDLLRALSAYPSDRLPASDAERVYRAALLLSVGHVEQAETLLQSLNETNSNMRLLRLANALRVMVAAVNVDGKPSPFSSQTSTPLATELLARSYFEQSQFRLTEALALARRCTEVSPDFAFGWERLAELEFSHGHIKAAMSALNRSLSLAPRNAQAIALRGFLLSAQNQIDHALTAFDEALTLDGGLGNAWLGRGLCRIRRGDAEGGRFDLQVAATLEPQRSALRSYLGKAFSNAGDAEHAAKELGVAKNLDPQDPTPWLYSALLLRDTNRINEAVRDLERSQELNDNRRVYRSRLLLDQDQAVRGANLASVFQEAGLDEVSVREAVRAVNSDYANYSAHLFLANSYNQLRDPNQVNLRYESAWFSEYLLANLLAPVGAGTLSQTVSQQEYSKLFERDRLGLSSSTDYFSDGEWFQQTAQYGVQGNSSYAADVFYHAADGQRPNNDIEQLATVLNLKHQFTPQDGAYLRLSYYNAESGDVFPYYSQEQANPGLRMRERHEPWLLAGYHREWQPGHQTLALVGRFQGRFEVDNPFQSMPVFNRGFGGPAIQVAPLLSAQDYQSELELYSAELQDIWQRGDHTFVLGGTYQSGAFDTRNRQDSFRFPDGTPVTLGVTQNVRTDLLRLGTYVYDQWQIHASLTLVGGIAFDHVMFPEDHRYAPLVEGEETREQVSPKAGFIWNPWRDTTLRGAYSQGLGGASLDQSVRLEPSQVAGFNQAFRSVIPESVAGANSAPTFESRGISLEQKLGKHTFFGLAVEELTSDVGRTVGVVNFVIPPALGSGFSAGATREELNYRERNLTVTLNQLVGDEWAFGVRYRIRNAELDDMFPEVPITATALGGFQPERNLEATLHQVQLSARFNHRSGFFATAEAIWTSQSNRGYAPDLPGDEFWQFDVEAGYRFAQRRAELRVGLLNITDQDYSLNPLNLTRELPRERTLALSLAFNF